MALREILRVGTPDFIDMDADVKPFIVTNNGLLGRTEPTQ